MSLCKLEDFIDMGEEVKQWLKNHPEAEEQVREELYQQFAAKVVDEWNKIPLINPVTPQELEKAIAYAEK